MREFLRYLLVVAAVIMVAVGDVWGQTCNGGTWYSLYVEGEQSIGTIASKTYNTFTPVMSNLSFQAKRSSSVSFGNLKVAPFVNDVQQNNVFDKQLTNSYATYTASITNSNSDKIKFYTTSGATLTKYFQNIKLPLAKHILLESGTYGTSSITVTDGNLATAEGYTSTNAYKIKLRSFLASGNIKMISSNPEFHFGGGITEIYLGVANNYCASANGSGTCTNASTLGHISSYYKDVYFSPSVQYNANARSTIITITDGVNTAYVYLTAPVIPTYYFKADAVASPAGGGSVSATFANGQSTCSVVASSYDVQSANAEVTFSMNGCAANHVFEGWKANPGDANYLAGLQGADKTSFTRTITSNVLNPSNLTSPQLTCYAIFSSRFTATITGSNFENKLVGEPFAADYNFISTQTSKPSASDADPFYFVIVHNFEGNDTREGSPRPNEVIAYDPESNTITPLNEGTATITFYQKNTDSHNAVSKSFTVKVIKHTPSFALKPDALYFNDEYPDYFTTTADSRLTITSSDTLVAKWVPGSNAQSYTLKTFSKKSVATLTAVQHENYKWYPLEGSVDIQVNKRDNHVQVDLTADNYRSLITESYYGLTWYNGGVHIGDASGGGFNYDKKYVVIEFTGVPDRLSFNAVGTGGATGEYYYIQQGSSKDNLSSTKLSESESKNWDVNVALDPSTRCVKLWYEGNFATTFRNVRITERKEFYASQVNTTTRIKELNFNKDANGDDKENQVNAPYSLSFDFHYANIGHDVKLSTNDPEHFTISQESFKDLGGEQVGKRTITVTYSSPTEYNVEKELYITDELDSTYTIALKAATVKATQTLSWQGVYAAVKPVVRISEGAVSRLATASSSLPVTYRSSDESIVKVSEDSLSLIPLQASEAVEITAVQKGNDVWKEVKETKTFRVTDKKTQLIHWPNTLSDLVIGGADGALDAKVYIVDDITGEYTYSAERTANLVYSVENTNVVNIEDGVLRIKSVGETYLTVTSPGDAQYAEASIKEYVRVRTVSTGCEDNLLHTSYTDSELEFFRMNLSAIQHGPFDIDCTLGEPDYITLQHRGVAWGLNCDGTFEVLYSTEVGSDDLKSAGTFSPTKNQTNVATIDLPRNAVQFYIKRLYGGTGYHYISNIKVYPDQFVETNVAEIDFGNIYVGSQVTQTFGVNYCNIKSEIYPQTSSDDVQVLPGSFGECNGYGSQSITLAWTPSSVNEEEQTVTIADSVSGKSVSVRIYANVFKGTQNLSWTAPSKIETCTQLILPEESDEHISLDWSLVAGSAYADYEDGKLAIKGSGTITLRASNQGSENYNEFQKDYQIKIVYSPIFLGSVDDDWTNPDNWNVCYLPSENDVVTFQAPVVLETPQRVAGLVLENEASIYIKSTAGLTVGVAGIVGAKEDGTSILIDNSPLGAGFLKVNPAAVNKPAMVTVNYSTEAYDSGYARDEVWQYMGAPGEGMVMSDVEKTTIYHWDEQNGWKKQPDASLAPFVGYAFTQSKSDSATFKVVAKPIIPEEIQEISLTLTPSAMGGSNLFVNSFLAPIDLTKFDKDDFEGEVEQTFYLFNSGSWHQWQQEGGKEQMKYGVSPGQYYALSLLGSSLMDPQYDQTTIPPMQGVYVIAKDNNAKIKLDYAKHVCAAEASNQAMRAPQRQVDEFKRARLQVNSANSGADRMYVIQHPGGTAMYDNGYDAKNLPVNGQVSIYTNEEAGQMEISVSDKMDSTYVGFRAGSDREYKLHVTSIVGERLFLQDLEANVLIPLENDAEYSFSATPNSVNDRRFLLLDRMSDIATEGEGVDMIDMYISNNKVYINHAPANSQMAVYTIGGVILSNYSIGETPCVVDLAALSTGVYILRIQNKSYKFVCK